MTEQQPVPVVPATLATLTYNGPVPYPHRAVAEPTPDDQYAEHMSKAEEETKQKEAAFQAEQEKTKAATGTSAMGKFSMFAKGVAHNVTKSATQLHDAVEAKVRMEMKQRDAAKFTTLYPGQTGSKYFCVYSCKVMNAGGTVSGDIYVSSSHFSFSAGPIRVEIPWANVLSIQRSVVLPTVSRGAPFILPVPAEHVIPHCLQIYTNDMKIYQFLDFANTATTASSHLTSTITGTSLERCYNFIDHAWRASCTVPQPGANYLPPPQ